MIEEAELGPEEERDTAGGRVAEVPRPTVCGTPLWSFDCGAKGMAGAGGLDLIRKVGTGAPRRAGWTGLTTRSRGAGEGVIARG